MYNWYDVYTRLSLLQKKKKKKKKRNQYNTYGYIFENRKDDTHKGLYIYTNGIHADRVYITILYILLYPHVLAATQLTQRNGPILWDRCVSQTECTQYT